MSSSAHNDSIVDLSIVISDYHSLLLSSSRDGIINVWRSDWLVNDVNVFNK
jgi:hypothetical protein